MDDGLINASSFAFREFGLEVSVRRSCLLVVVQNGRLGKRDVDVEFYNT